MGEIPRLTVRLMAPTTVGGWMVVALTRLTGIPEEPYHPRSDLRQWWRLAGLPATGVWLYLGTRDAASSFLW